MAEVANPPSPRVTVTRLTWDRSLRSLNGFVIQETKSVGNPWANVKTAERLSRHPNRARPETAHPAVSASRPAGALREQTAAGSLESKLGQASRWESSGTWRSDVPGRRRIMSVMHRTQGVSKRAFSAQLRRNQCFLTSREKHTPGKRTLSIQDSQGRNDFGETPIPAAETLVPTPVPEICPRA